MLQNRKIKKINFDILMNNKKIKKMEEVKKLKNEYVTIYIPLFLNSTFLN